MNILVSKVLTSLAVITAGGVAVFANTQILSANPATALDPSQPAQDGQESPIPAITFLDPNSSAEELEELLASSNGGYEWIDSDNNGIISVEELNPTNENPTGNPKPNDSGSEEEVVISTPKPEKPKPDSTSGGSAYYEEEDDDDDYEEEEEEEEEEDD